ncbi:hypothetical protein [Zoogloea sp.]|uniref:hypothetical protein n=1 Tax=Zoogloea sp. TaxID=49181 RepID=UPI0035B0A952
MRTDLIHLPVVVDAGDAFLARGEADLDEVGGGDADADAEAGEDGLADLAFGGEAEVLVIGEGVKEAA